MANNYPCDGPYGGCPFHAEGGYDCRNFCGLGVDEDEEEDYYPDEDMEINFDNEKENDTMATINTIKNPIEIRAELKANGTTIEYIVINGQKCGILGSTGKHDRENAIKALNDAYIASGGDIYQMMQNLDAIATMTEKEIDPDEVVQVCDEDIILSYTNAKAYTMGGEEIANCDDLPAMPIEAIKAVLMARVEAAFN